jgi:D-tyrosyl-tRNA(Tyr) deacylase
LAVSQFTLLGDCRTGKRPSFAGAMPPADAGARFARFVELLTAAAAGPVATGRFGATMKVTLVNDGPVTLVVDA